MHIFDPYIFKYHTILKYLLKVSMYRLYFRLCAGSVLCSNYVIYFNASFNKSKVLTAIIYVKLPSPHRYFSII